ncbi:hypothetical protein [Deinococcus petrolearius]|uniref:Uncharacterized protein n=1 Tax=Deinococcus petrolearius TaxID=1751295 RepID=A0ABW1DHD3_9DEIO
MTGADPPCPGQRVYFGVQGMLFTGRVVCCAAAPDLQDDLLSALSWPPGTVVVAHVRLLVRDVPVASCMVVPLTALLGGRDGDG